MQLPSLLSDSFSWISNFPVPAMMPENFSYLGLTIDFGISSRAAVGIDYSTLDFSFLEKRSDYVYGSYYLHTIQLQGGFDHFLHGGGDSPFSSSACSVISVPEESFDPSHYLKYRAFDADSAWVYYAPGVTPGLESINYLPVDSADVFSVETGASVVVRGSAPSLPIMPVKSSEVVPASGTSLLASFVYGASSVLAKCVPLIIVSAFWGL